jgi:hypothetical protein
MSAICLNNFRTYIYVCKNQKIELSFWLGYGIGAKIEILETLMSKIDKKSDFY